MTTKPGNADLHLSQTLTADHTRLDAHLEDARRDAARADFDRASASFAGLEQGLAHHIAVEEQLLFPAFGARARMPGPTEVMRHEHRGIERLLALANASLKARDAARFADAAAELAALLAAHNMKEERVLYPRAEAALDESERARVVAALPRDEGR